MNARLKQQALKEVLQALEKTAPLCLAEEWDNVGLLVEPSSFKNVSGILLCIDLNEAVFKEAVKNKCNFIVAYHPVIFDGLKRLTMNDPKHKLLLKLIDKGIGVYSPHTALDSVQGGVNDWLSDAFGDSSRCPLEPLISDPAIGQGRLVKLAKPISLIQAQALIKKHLSLKHLRVAAAGNTKIKTIALCAGAGASVICNTGADLLFTGEMRHHDVLQANAKGSHVILCEHTNTERGYLKILKKSLHSLLGKEINIIISKEDRDPLKVK